MGAAVAAVAVAAGTGAIVDVVLVVAAAPIAALVGCSSVRPKRGGRASLRRDRWLKRSSASRWVTLRKRPTQATVHQIEGTGRRSAQLGLTGTCSVVDTSAAGRGQRSG